MNATEALDRARELSHGLAEWIDGQRKAGRKEAEILIVLKAATDLARYERKQP